MAARALPHKLRWSLRGPVRHPSAYRISSFVGFSGPIYLWAGLAVGLSALAMVSDKLGTLLRMYLALCEARDLMDELKARLANRSGRLHNSGT